jgi:hypothetical protein
MADTTQAAQSKKAEPTPLNLRLAEALLAIRGLNFSIEEVRSELDSEGRRDTKSHDIVTFLDGELYAMQTNVRALASELRRMKRDLPQRMLMRVEEVAHD